MNKLRVIFSLLVFSPKRSALILISSLIAGILEGASIVSLLPVITIVLGLDNQPGESGFIFQSLEQFFALLNIEISLLSVLSSFFIFVLLKSLFSLGAMNYIGKVIAKITYEMRVIFINSLLAVKLETIQTLKSGSSLNTLNYEIPKAASLYRYSCVLIASLFQVLILSYLMFEISSLSALGGLALGIVMFLFLGVFIRIAGEQSKRQVSLMNSLISEINEVLKGIKVIKAMNLGSLVSPILLQETDSIRDAMQKQVVAKHGLSYLREPIIMFFVCVGLYLSVVALGLSPEIVLITIVIFVRLATSMGMLQSDYQTFVVNEHFFNAHKLKADNLSKNQEILNSKQKKYQEVNIPFENATFSYDERKILDNINLNLPSYGLISIEGESGVGKTTFVDILLGFYDLDSGRILINNEDLSENKENIRACSGYVEQESFIFHNSVFTNIVMGDPNISREQAIASLDQAKAYEFINKLEHGIDSDLGESGSKLSGGQKQRIAIARALVRDPKILILDEFTSALDKRTSEELIEVILKISKSILVVAITHDKSVIDVADHKYEIKNGNIFKK